jgi:NADP-dependent 3-hydroxy acid dehydrogenase YdfG
MQMTKPSVLVTGASSGIGAATANLLLDRGWRVFAAARRLEPMAALEAQGAELFQLDLSKNQSRSALATELQSRVGALDALVKKLAAR